MNQPTPNRMLVLLAHPDDESFAVGGTLAKFAHQGVQVILLCATRGEAGIAGVASQKAGSIREDELREAAKHLGIEVYFLDYQDGQLADINPHDLLKHIAAWMDVVQPQVILTFGPDGISGHPDHVTISQVVTQAYDQFYQQGILLYISPSEATALGCGVSIPETTDGQWLVDIDISDYKQEKVRAIQSHVSQSPDLIGKPEEVMDKIPCSEVYVIARNMPSRNAESNWFEFAQGEITTADKAHA